MLKPESYSPEKFNNAEKDSLEPADAERLKYFREAKERWKSAFDTKDSSAISEIISVWKQVREPFRPSVRKYLSEKGRAEYNELEAKQAQTKEGQLELANEEASFLNDAFDVRAKRLEEAVQKKDQSPEAAAEYDMALNDFNEIVKDLNEGDLSRYSLGIERRKSDDEFFHHTNKSDLRPHDGPRAKWEVTPSSEETEILGLLEKLPGGPEARDLFVRLQDSNLSVENCFKAMNSYYNQHTDHHSEGTGAEPHEIIKSLSNNLWLRLQFWDNGRIEFSGFVE